MIKRIKIEFMKMRRCHIFFIMLVLACGHVVFGLKGNYDNEDFLRMGWMMWLYQLPLINAMFLPFISAVLASLLISIEHKAGMSRRLCTVEKRSELYNSKLASGLIIMALLTVFTWAATLCYGHYLGFKGGCPMGFYFKYLIFTLVPTVSIYMLEHALFMLFPNPSAGFIVSIIGEFIGVFSMFIPQYPWIRHMTPWGYYGALQFVGFYGWTKETRYKYAYFEAFDTSWASFAVITAMGILFYIGGRYFFEKKEL